MRMRRAPTEPPAHKHSRSSSSARSELISKEKTKTRSAKRTTVLAKRSHGTYHAFSRERPPRANSRAARRLRPFDDYAKCSRRDAVQIGMLEALQRRASERPLVGCYAELGGAAIRVTSASPITT